MKGEVDYIICNNCETPCYVFDVDRRGSITSAYCQACGNDDPAEFRLPEDEGDEA